MFIHSVNSKTGILGGSGTAFCWGLRFEELTARNHIASRRRTTRRRTTETEEREREKKKRERERGKGDVYLTLIVVPACSKSRDLCSGIRSS